MELANSTIQKNYTKQLQELEAKIEKATEGQPDPASLNDAQKKLDVLAKKYQYSNKIGSAAYKLYELQAVIHYFNGNDLEALDFIDQAIETRGSNYPRAEKLKAQLTNTPKDATLSTTELSKSEKRKKLIGIEGWLAWYVLGLFIGTGVTIFNFFNGGISLSPSDIGKLNQYQSGLGDTFRTLTTFENIALIIYIALLISTIVLILQRKRLAKTVAIAGMIFGAAYTITDYAITSSLFDSANLTQYVKPELNTAAGYASRDTIIALIWIPYFLVSKRVKATLTK